MGRRFLKKTDVAKAKGQYMRGIFAAELFAIVRIKISDFYFELCFGDIPWLARN